MRAADASPEFASRPRPLPRERGQTPFKDVGDFPLDGNFRVGQTDGEGIPRPHSLRSFPVTDPADVQRRYKEFIDLLPLTLTLAGLPTSDHGRYFSEEQIEARLFTIRHAYKAARQLVREAIQK